MRILPVALGLVLASYAVRVLAAPALPKFTESVVGSKHDLSASAPGPIKSSTEGDVCIFCHTPHGGSPQAPLWNRYDSGEGSYTPYDSSTVKANPKPNQPTGASKLCLSCHDGTVALGMVRSRSSAIPFVGGVDRIPVGRSNLGTDLSNDHPVSFFYDNTLAIANGELVDPSTLTGHVRLDRTGQMQCTACHDPHHNDNGKFLVMNNTESALCMECHDEVKMDWSSIHRTSEATWDGNGTDPWPHKEGTTVRANGCENCHTPHAAGTGERLLNFAPAEDNCYSCHSGHVASKNKNVERVFTKLYKHPVASAGGAHDPLENLVDPADGRHVTCADCHNPHAATTAGGAAPNASGALAGVAGVDATTGDPVKPVVYEYELCFRCHGDSSGKKPPRFARQFPETNTRLEFDEGNASFHPIEVKGASSAVPSLISSRWSVDSRIYCTDCHNNDEGPGAGGSGPNGPHGSIYEPLLERNLTTTDGPESVADYALCYKCHSRSSILANASFPEHAKHVLGAWPTSTSTGTACSTCHDPHGVKDIKHLINFNTAVVTASTNGLLEYVSTGVLHGNCSLTCHGTDHAEKKY